MQPPPSPESFNEPLYEAFYGLREQPFSLTTDPRFLYLSQQHRRAFDELLTGLRRHEGLLLLTGDTGTGKTTLCRAVIDALGHRTFSALILNPYMSDAEVLRTILREFGLVTREDIRKGAFDNADVPQLLDTLESFLRSLVPLNSYAVVIIDEAQSLSAKVLDQVRVLGSMEQDGRRLLQIVLVGQPSLIDTLRSDTMRALADRVSRRSALDPLPASDVNAYVAHRLQIAGGKDAVKFDADALARIADLSDGLPRRINLLCDRALELGRVAGVTTIGAPLITQAAKSIAGARLDPALQSQAPVAPAPVATPASRPSPAPSPAPAPAPAAATSAASADASAIHDLPELHVPPPRAGAGAFISDLDLPDIDLAAIADGPRHDEEPSLRLIMDQPPRSNTWFYWMLAAIAVIFLALGYTSLRLGWLRF
jgi:general secretion pathway protein A